jgi:hypothetical protein
MPDKHFDPNEKHFAHERLVAYDLALEATHFVASRRAKLRGLPGQAGPQLERAVVGAHTNLCAGAAQDGAEAKRHFRIALSEASEAGGANDVALAFGAFSQTEHAQLRAVLLRLAATLRGLSRR